MSLSNQVKTEILQPRIFASGNRAEWRFDGSSVYTSNLRVCNLGMYRTTGGAKNYNRIGGQYEVLKNVRLLDGNTEIASLYNADKYLTFKNLNNTNSQNRSSNAVLSLHTLGYENKGVSVDTANMEVSETTGATPVNASANSGDNGWFYLSEALPLLRSMTFLNTSMFKNLRLVVEFNNPGAGYANNRPVLVAENVVDEEIKSKIMSSEKSFEFTDIEHELFIVPENQDVSAALFSSQQRVNPQIKGFNNKVLSNLLMAKAPTANLVNEIGDLCSMAQINESVNFIVNDTVLYEDAYNRPNKILGRSNDAVGVMNTPTGALKAQAAYAANNEIMGSDVRNVVGRCNYVSTNINDRVRNMRVEYERLACYDADAQANAVKRYSQQLVCHLFGEVTKVMNYSNGGYLISYA